MTASVQLLRYNYLIRSCQLCLYNQIRQAVVLRLMGQNYRRCSKACTQRCSEPCQSTNCEHQATSRFAEGVEPRSHHLPARSEGAVCVSGEHLPQPQRNQPTNQLTEKMLFAGGLNFLLCCKNICR